MISRSLPTGLRASIDTKLLRLACARVCRVAESKSTMPILGAVVLHSGGDSLELSAYDLEVRVVSTHEAIIHRAGSLALPAKALKSFADKASGENVSIEGLSNHRALLKSGSTEFELVGSDPTEAPDVAVPDNMDFAPVSATALAEMIDGVRASICTDGTRVNLCGALLLSTNVGMRMVSTDGHRMSVCDRHTENSALLAIPRPVILPVKAVDLVRALLDEQLEDMDQALTIEIGVVETLAGFRRQGLHVLTRLVDGQFPDYTQVLPDAAEAELVLTTSRSGLLAALDRLAPVCGKQHAVSLGVTGELVRLHAQDPDVGSITDTVVMERSGSRSRLAVGVNTAYLKEALSALPDAFVQVHLFDELAPLLLSGKESALQQHVIMPMRTGASDHAQDQHRDAFPEMRDILIELDRATGALERVEAHGRAAGRRARDEKGRAFTKEEAEFLHVSLNDSAALVPFIKDTSVLLFNAETAWTRAFRSEAMKEPRAKAEAPATEEHSGTETPPAGSVQEAVQDFKDFVAANGGGMTFTGPDGVEHVIVEKPTPDEQAAAAERLGRSELSKAGERIMCVTCETSRPVRVPHWIPLAHSGPCGKPCQGGVNPMLAQAMEGSVHTKEACPFCADPSLKTDIEASGQDDDEELSEREGQPVRPLPNDAPSSLPEGQDADDAPLKLSGKMKEIPIGDEGAEEPVTGQAAVEKWREQVGADAVIREKLIAFGRECETALKRFGEKFPASRRKRLLWPVNQIATWDLLTKQIGRELTDEDKADVIGAYADACCEPSRAKKSKAKAEAET